MSLYDSDNESEPTSLHSSRDDAELCIPPPRLPPRPSVLPSFPHGPLFVGDRFPFPEGQQVEFKETWGACTTSKMHETICAFLNSAGGYLMYGIKDCGKIIGMSRDEADKILLRADDLFHTKKIVDCETGKEPHASCVRGSIVRLCTILNSRPHPTERFLIILAITSMDHNITYRMTCGDIMIRLSASNYRSKSTTLTTYEEIIRDNRQLEAEKTKYYQERNRFRKEFMLMENSHRELSIKIKECMMDVATARAESQAALDMLHARILTEKTHVTQKLQAQKDQERTSFMSTLVSSVFGCFTHP